MLPETVLLQLSQRKSVSTNTFQSPGLTPVWSERHMTAGPLSSLNKPKRSRKKLYWIIGIVVVIAIAAVVASGMAKKREKPILVTTDKAFRKTITQLVTATGKIQPEIEVKISPEVSGEIIEMPVKEGQIVHKGATPSAHQARHVSRAGRRAAGRAERRARRERAQQAAAGEGGERTTSARKRLFESRLIPESDRKTAQTQLRDRASRRSTRRSSTSSAPRVRCGRSIEALSKTTIYSPTDGSISSLTSRLGERVVGTSQFAGTEVMRIADLEQHGGARQRQRERHRQREGRRRGAHQRRRLSRPQDPRRRARDRQHRHDAQRRHAGRGHEFRSEDQRPRPLRAAASRHEHDRRHRDRHGAERVAVPIQSVTVRTHATASSRPRSARNRRAQQRARKDDDNRAEVTNETLEKQKEREQRDKLQRVVFIKNGDNVRMQKVETGIADTTFIEIKSGIKPGDEVVSGSYTAISRKLKDGAKVAIEKAGKGSETRMQGRSC